MKIDDLFKPIYEPVNEEKRKRSVPNPKAPFRGCTCIARADADDTMPGNLKSGHPLYVIAEATAADCATASKEAKRIAIQKLGMKPKHVKCRCSKKE